MRDYYYLNLYICAVILYCKMRKFIKYISFARFITIRYDVLRGYFLLALDRVGALIFEYYIKKA